jgi:hypothetical protein
MSNHPNRVRFPYKVHASVPMAAFASYSHAMNYARDLSKASPGALVEVHEKSGIVGQYQNGETTEEFVHHHLSAGIGYNLTLGGEPGFHGTGPILLDNQPCGIDWQIQGAILEARGALAPFKSIAAARTRAELLTKVRQYLEHSL